MIIAKSYAIAAVTGSTFQGVGSRFVLVAASAPVNILLYRGSQLVGEADGVSAGLKLGPFCPDFTAWNAVTLSGLSGVVNVIVADEDTDHNTVAESMNFLTLGSNTRAQLSTPSDPVSLVQVASPYMVMVPVPPVVGRFCVASLSSAAPNGLSALISRLLIYNSSAAQAVFSLQSGVAPAGLTPVAAFFPKNMANGIAPAYVRGVGSVAALPLSLAEQYVVAAGQVSVVDLSKNPYLISSKNNNIALNVYMGTLDVGFSCGFDWTEL